MMRPPRPANPPVHRIRGAALPRPAAHRPWPLRLFVAALVGVCVGLLFVILLLVELVAGPQQQDRAGHSMRNPRGSASPKTVRCSSSRSCPPSLTSSTRCGGADRA